MFGITKRRGVYFLDKLIYVIGTAAPLMAIPQALTGWITQDVSGLNLFTWCAFLVIASIWTVYGYVHKLYPILISNILWMIVDIMVIASILMYR
ncbi:MAG: hypothetical protein ACMXYC_02600 [Candidatus Woesearchaeota archaeon]